MKESLRWPILIIALLMTLGSACTPQPSSPQPAAETKPSGTVAVKVSEAIAPATPAMGAAASEAAATPTLSAKTAASPGPVARGEPKGQVVYAIYFGLTPSWLDPQENPALVTPYAFQYAVHDALVKHLPGQPLAPSLAESYHIADDFKSATFKLREGVKFHNGEPVTPEDVKFTFENYRGANAKVLKEKTERIEIADSRTIQFHFKEPFLDFLTIYGSPASGAGWVVPKKYYEAVGPDGFKQKPIGAGPYRFVRQDAGNTWELEAVAEYWRKTPSVKTIIVRGVTEDSTRLAMLQTGEADLMYLVPGPMIDMVKQDPNLTLAPVLGVSTFWLEFPGWEKPENQFHDRRVRQAVSLALDREAINQAEYGGFSQILGNWIPENLPGAITAPKPDHDLAKAKQLMAEAGVPNGFEVEGLTPIPPYASMGERVISQLREIGIRTKLNTMERAAFFTKLAGGPDAFKGIVLTASGAPGDAAGRIRSWAICDGVNSRTCIPEIDQKFHRYDESTDPRERERHIAEIQQYLIDHHIFTPLWLQAGVGAQGPRITNKDEIWGAIPQFPVVGPFEDIKLKE